MRIWHKDLISALPLAQVSAQWRDCNSIIKTIVKEGELKDSLINPILDYNLGHFLLYTSLIMDEMIKRGYKADSRKFDLYYNQTNLKKEVIPDYDDLFKNWHNKRYLMQCYYNLQEKFDRGNISKEDWEKIENKYNKSIKKYK